jgi:5-methyltetrahydrofolate--homocysteine methyltransferase
MDLLNEISKNLQEGSPERVKKGIEQALAEGNSPHDILHKGLIAGMNTIAEKFKTGQMYLPEVLMVVGAMKMGLSIVRPLLTRDGIDPEGKILLGTVRGDIHDIGKNLVGIMLQGAGYEVIDLGTNIQAEQFADAVEKERPHVLGLSALLTTTMVHMQKVIEALEKRQLRAKVKVIIGGAPVSRSYAEEIKADGYARDAATAVDLVRNLLNKPAA